MNRARRIIYVLCVALCLAPSITQAITAADLGSVTNDTIYYDPTDQCAAGTSSDTGIGTPLVGKDNTMKAFNYLIPKGLSATQVAGIIGNLMAESGLNPTASESGGVATVPVNGVGFGIAQWTYTVRQQPLVDLAKTEKKPPTDLGVQLDYLWMELSGKAPATNYSFALANLKKQTTVRGAAVGFMNDYEAPKERVVNGVVRATFAQAAFDEFSKTNGGASPGVSSAPAGACSGGGAVDCTPGTTTTNSLSPVRQSIVCITQAELKKWTSHQLKPADGYLGYSENVKEEWCADFASWVYNQAKDPLQSPDWKVPAVASIQTIGQKGGKFAWHDVNGYTPQPGDLAIHGSQHVNIVVAVSGKNMTLIGGDQGPGPYPGGSYVSQYSEPISGGPGDGITGYVSPN